ncbi:hypothetical protein SAMN04488041_11314 [Sulfitobacter pontiacus]|uniref:Uncharacterized protein n=1 Tax=Sulfitobacter pontiacus TaxID=60137 RepID=A0A1H3DWW7_9RHOB|nr:hypothetical protein [Sulfitobacter sp. UBA1132]SDX70184.1 hypothetical protein SAMN04488041_11314 [Sulfitobacter pontiacus]|tara:strand:+ start:1267 stop:1716 length:450 start_codon:yes stop_codon:yes gene_type:complete
MRCVLLIYERAAFCAPSLSGEGIDSNTSGPYISSMRILLRLATFCLSLVLLTGILAHDLAAANMSMQMSGVTSSAIMEEDGGCTACLQENQGEAVCDIDCTAPVFVTSQMLQSQPESVQGFFVPVPGDLDLTGVDPGSDPFPPRTISLS